MPCGRRAAGNDRASCSLTRNDTEQQDASTPGNVEPTHQMPDAAAMKTACMKKAVMCHL